MLAASAGNCQDVALAVPACLDALDRARGSDDGADEPLVVDYCPTLIRRLRASDWGSALDKETIAFMKAEQLGVVADLDRAYSAPRRSGRVSTDGLALTLAELGTFEPPPTMTLWEQFVAFLERLFGVDDSDSSWLVDWLESFSIPEAWRKVILYAVAASIVVGVVAIVVNEVRHGMVPGRGRREGRRAGSSETFERSSPVGGLDAVRGAPLARQPLLLLALVLEALAARRGRGFGEDLTHRELVAEVGGMGIDPAGFGRVAAAAERVTFAGWTPTEGELEPVWSSSEELLESPESEAPDERGSGAPGPTPR